MMFRKIDIKNNKGFTLVELLGVLGILAIIMLIGVPVFLNLRDNVLEGERKNVVSYIEARAADYANDTSITVVSVEDLIQEGYVEPDDETDIYNPVTNESYNCYIVTSSFNNGVYESTMSEESVGVDASGTCNSYQKELDLAICKYNLDETDCTLIDNNSWSKDDMKLGVRYRTGNILKASDATFDWLGSDGSTSKEYYINTSTNLISQNVYRVIVTMEDGVSEVTQAINIDKQAPAVVSYSINPMGTEWSRTKEVSFEVTDFAGSGVAGVYVGTSTTCSESLDYGTGEIVDNVYKKVFASPGTFNVCVKDKVGNISDEPYQITVENVDGIGAEDISLTGSPTSYTDSVNLTGTAIDTNSGLVAYQFNQSSSVPSSGWINITKTNNRITQYRNGITSNGTWYFWVKDSVGNTSSARYTINNIDKSKPTATLSPSTTGYATSLTLNGVGTDSLSGIKRYVITTSASKPSSGWTTLSTPQQRITTNYNVTRNGTYYLWVEDAAGNSAMASYRVTNIVTLRTETMRLTTEPEESDRISDYITIPGIVELVDVEITSGGGYVSDSYMRGERVYVSVRGGDGYRDTCWREESYRAEEVCEYYCDRGDGEPDRHGTCYHEEEEDIRGYCYCYGPDENGDFWEDDCTDIVKEYERDGWECDEGETDDVCRREGQKTYYDAYCWIEEEYDADEDCWYECDSRYDELDGRYCYYEEDYTCYYYDYRVRISYYYSEYA